MHNYRVFIRGRNSCVSDLNISISVASQFEMYHQTIAQFIDFKVLLLVRKLFISWCYFVALGLSEEVWKGNVPQNQRWSGELLVLNEVKHLSLALVFIQYKILHRWYWPLSKLPIARVPLADTGRVISRMVFFQSLFLFYILCLCPLLTSFFGRACLT